MENVSYFCEKLLTGLCINLCIFLIELYSVHYCRSAYTLYVAAAMKTLNFFKVSLLKPWDEQEDADENGPSASKRPKTKYVNVPIFFEKNRGLHCYAACNCCFLTVNVNTIFE
jgi:hypothetical protein